MLSLSRGSRNLYRIAAYNPKALILSSARHSFSRSHLIARPPSLLRRPPLRLLHARQRCRRRRRQWRHDERSASTGGARHHRAGRAGRVTLRASRITRPMKIDGVLDEEAYLVTAPMGDFVQTEPNRGQPAPSRPRCGFSTTGARLRRRKVLRLRRLKTAGWPTKCAATASTSCATRTSRSTSTPSTTGATHSSSKCRRSGASTMRT